MTSPQDKNNPKTSRKGREQGGVNKCSRARGTVADGLAQETERTAEQPMGVTEPKGQYEPAGHGFVVPDDWPATQKYPAGHGKPEHIELLVAFTAVL
jgi:hypothetical protein